MATDRTRPDGLAGVVSAPAPLSGDEAQTYRAFKHVVNMSAASLARWLGTDESRSVGDGPAAAGHPSGRRIVELLHTKKADLTDADYAHMHEVIGYVTRRLAQRPDGDVRDTRWRWSLMNRGHDPLKN
jgi:hypothetical protein